MLARRFTIVCLLTAHGWYANAITLWHLVAGLFA